jgi:uncharacterized protein (TIGR00251 family)
VTGPVQETADGVLLFARIAPKSSADRLGPLHDGRLKIAVTAAPDKGKANAHLLKLLAKKLGVPKSALEIVAGETDRAKTIRVRGLSAAQVRDKLGL